MSRSLLFTLKYLGLALLALSFQACVDQDFDEPPIGGEPVDISANTTIAELRQLHTLGEFEEITSDLIIEGIVVADDRSGNFFRNVVIQDATAGIELRLNSVEIFSEFPEGTQLFIRCNGLYLGDYNNLVQMGGSLVVDDGETELLGIEPALFDTYIVKGLSGQFVTPLETTIPELGVEHHSTLIQLNNVQFINSDAGQTYADAENQFSINRLLEDCFGNQITLRSSGYADFADDITPTGNGSVTAIFSVFRTTDQLFIRDLDDVLMSGDRCNSTPVVTDLNESFSSLNDNDDIMLSSWSNVSVEGDRLWRAKEFDDNIYAQATSFGGTAPSYEMWLITPGIDVSGGKTLRFESAMAFWNHDGLSIWISTDFDGSNVTSANWDELDCTLANNSSGDHNWVDSGAIDLSAYSGQVFIGFKYVGNNSNNTTSYRVDNIVIE